MVKESGHVIPEMSVENENGGQDGQSPSRCSPCHFPDCDHKERGKEEIPGSRDNSHTINPVVEIDENIDHRNDQHEDQHIVEDMHSVFSGSFPPGPKGD